MVNNKKGFTLMELLIVIAIIAILTVSFLPSALKAPAKARDAVRIKKVMDIQSAVESYIAEKGSIPASSAVGGEENCFTDAIALTVGISKAAVDTGTLGSCPTANLFYYKSAPGLAAIADRFYIVASIVEVPASGNSTSVLATVGAIPGYSTVATLSAAKALIPAVKPAAGASFLAVGPI